MDKTNILDLFDDVARISKDVSIKYFRNIYYENKSDFSPVTAADREIETGVIACINALYKDIGKEYNYEIISEEFGYYSHTNLKGQKIHHSWYIDPIDGTNSFVVGKPLFTTMIALYINNQPYASMIYQPIMNEMWHTIQGIFYYEGEIIQSQPRNIKMENIRIATTSPLYLHDFGTRLMHQLYEDLTIHNFVFGGDAYNYMLLAMGKIDVIVEMDLKIFDIAPIIPCLLASNSCFASLDDRELLIKSSYKDQLFSIVATRNKEIMSFVQDAIEKL